MFRFINRFINKLKRWYRHRQLVQQGVLTPIESYEQYTGLVKDIKANSTQKVFTNCYIMPAEVKRLISLGALYKLKTNCGLAFADDEGGYYYLFLYTDMSQPLELPAVEKDILVEDVYYDGRQTGAQIKFEAYVQNSGCIFLSKYNSVTDRPQISPERYWKQLSALEKALAAEGKKICQPEDGQLKQFERIYRKNINKYVQKKYSKKERKKQRDLGYLHCVADDKGELYAIQISGIIHGGAIATRKDCQGSIYSPALMLYIWKGFYEAMPEDEGARKEYMRSRSISGWIAVDNKHSWRMHKALGFKAAGKSMNQFVLKSAM